MFRALTISGICLILIAPVTFIVFRMKGDPEGAAEAALLWMTPMWMGFACLLGAFVVYRRR